MKRKKVCIYAKSEGKILEICFMCSFMTFILHVMVTYLFESHKRYIHALFCSYIL